jgi:predicted MFS family arabinose efflux permease
VLKEERSVQRNSTTPKLRYIALLIFVAAFGGFLFGYDTAVVSDAIGFLRKNFDLTADLTGWAASSVLVGCMFGAMFLLWFACFLVSQTFPMPLEAFGPAITFWMYAACSLASLVFVMTLIPRHKRANPGRDRGQLAAVAISMEDIST